MRGWFGYEDIGFDYDRIRDGFIYPQATRQETRLTASKISFHQSGNSG